MQFFLINQMIATLAYLAAQPGVGDEYHEALLECIVALKRRSSASTRKSLHRFIADK